MCVRAHARACDGHNLLLNSYPSVTYITLYSYGSTALCACAYGWLDIGVCVGVCVLAACTRDTSTVVVPLHVMAQAAGVAQGKQPFKMSWPWVSSSGPSVSGAPAIGFQNARRCRGVVVGTAAPHRGE